MRTVLKIVALAAFSTLLTGCSQGRSNTVVTERGSGRKAKADLETKFSLAKIRENEGQVNQAKTIYEQLVTADPNRSEYRHRYGIALTRLGQFEDGMEQLRQADALDPDNPSILNDLGYCCIMAGRFDVAQQVLKTSQELNPTNERVQNNLAIAYGFAGEFDKAFATFRRTMPEAEALANLGYVATQTGRTDFAVDCYSRALRLDPTHRRAAEALAQIADLDRQVQQRRSIAQATQDGRPSIAQATAAPGKPSANSGPGNPSGPIQLTGGFTTDGRTQAPPR